MALFGKRPKPESDVPAEAEPVVTQSSRMSREELLAAVRVRLLHESGIEFFGIDYASRIGSDLIAVLCVDLPDTVEYLTNETVALHGARPLFDAGYRNVMAEKIDVIEELSPSVKILVGDSFFTASKALGMSQLAGTVLPAAPHGMLFGVPHRHMIIAHAVDGENSVEAMSLLSKAVAHYAGQDGVGGPISTSTYFFHDGVIDLASLVGDDGTFHVLGSSRFGEKVNELVSR